MSLFLIAAMHFLESLKESFELYSFTLYSTWLGVDGFYDASFQASTEHGKNVALLCRPNNTQEIDCATQAVRSCRAIQLLLQTMDGSFLDNGIE